MAFNIKELRMQVPDNVTPLDPSRSEADRAWNEKKKERTRQQLVEASMRLLCQKGPDSITINDVVTEASVAPGTFYNYFSSLDGLLEEIAQIVIEIVDANSAQRTRARDPGSRLATVLRAHLRRAREDRIWAGVVVSLASRATLRVRAQLLHGLEDDILDGISKGQFSAEADEAATDLVLGTLLAGMQRVAEGHVLIDYDRNLTANLLRGLGMVSAAALERSQRGL